MGVFSGSACCFGLWFRVFGYGLSVIDRSQVKAPFSVRIGVRKEWRLGRWGVKWLKP